MEAQWDGAPDQGFLKKKGGWGFPYCTVMTAAGEVIWEAAPADEDRWKKSMRRARRLLDLKAALKEKPDDKALKASYALLNALGCSQRKPGSLAELEAHAKVEGVDPKILEEFKPWLAEKKFSEKYSAAMRGIPRGERLAKALELYKGGLRAPKGSRSGIGLYQAAAYAALQEKDAATAEKAIADFEQSLTDAGITGDRADRAVQQLKDRLAKLKESDQP